ncbi:MAG TPA: hypothetical protein DEB39_10230 [Planctomycetaceae bacterium]|nr:hypothetical protein [Planctomycetaceae bacterium]
MDGERRRQLSQNLLGKWLLKLYEDLREPYAKVVYVVLVVALVILCVTLISSNFMQIQQKAQWESYFHSVGAATPEARTQAFQNLAATYTSGDMGARVRMTLAQFQLQEGANLLYTDRDEAMKQLESARTYFFSAEKLTSNSRLKEQIAFGLAATHESLAAVRTDKDDLDVAEKKYKEVFEFWPEGMFAERARQAHETITHSEGKKLYSMLASMKIEKPEPLNINLEKGDTIEGPTEFDPLKKLEE